MSVCIVLFLATLGISYWQTNGEKASEEMQDCHSIFQEFCMMTKLAQNENLSFLDPITAKTTQI